MLKIPFFKKKKMAVHCPQMCSLGEKNKQYKNIERKIQKHYLVGANHGHILMYTLTEICLYLFSLNVI